MQMPCVSSLSMRNLFCPFHLHVEQQWYNCKGELIDVTHHMATLPNRNCIRHVRDSLVLRVTIDLVILMRQMLGVVSGTCKVHMQRSCNMLVRAVLLNSMRMRIHLRIFVDSVLHS